MSIEQYRNKIVEGDCLEVMRQWSSECVDMCLTSPPYWGLRSYGGETVRAWTKRGAIGCEHEWQTSRGGSIDYVQGNPEFARPHREKKSFDTTTDSCVKCSAWRGQLGLEPTPELYVEHLVEVFREVKRVLRNDGTLWLNLGDSYAGSGRGPTGYDGIGDQEKRQGFVDPGAIVPQGLKPKDLVGIPWRVAFALQADGWYLRSDIIWHKLNPMPESVTDRPTKAHEYVFLLAKSQSYYFDQDAVREPHQTKNLEYEMKKQSKWGWKKKETSKPNVEAYHSAETHSYSVGGRNIRSVWTIPTRPFKGAHFATFPMKLCEMPIKAGCPKGGIVLDPFAGAGTACYVARALGRKYVGIELNKSYVKIARERLGMELEKFVGGE